MVLAVAARLLAFFGEVEGVVEEEEADDDGARDVGGMSEYI